jgi:hypothetical protein
MTLERYLLALFCALDEGEHRRGSDRLPLERALPCPVQGGHRPAQRTIDWVQQGHTLRQAGLATTSGGSPRASPAVRTCPLSGRGEGWAQRLISGPRFRSWRWGDGPAGRRPSGGLDRSASRRKGVPRTKRAISIANRRSSGRSEAPSACAIRTQASVAPPRLSIRASTTARAAAGRDVPLPVDSGAHRMRR